MKACWKKRKWNGPERQKKADDSKGKKNGRDKESNRKEEIASTEFPEGGDTIYSERAPGIPTGVHLLDVIFSKMYDEISNTACFRIALNSIEN